MWKEVILAYAHFAAIFTLLWFLAKEWTLLRMGADKLDTTALAKADAWFGIAAGLVLITGICRVTLGAKPASFYLHNPVFHTKVGLFVLVGLISIWPTIVFIRWRKARDADHDFPHSRRRMAQGAAPAHHRDASDRADSAGRRDHGARDRLPRLSGRE